LDHRLVHQNVEVKKVEVKVEVKIKDRRKTRKVEEKRCMDAWLSTFNHEIMQSNISYSSTSTLNFFFSTLALTLIPGKNSRLNTVPQDLN